ncbi:MAG: hypothetical protein LBT93_02145 [Treponema sp.]|jgi:hypothetical protein|nr:hypothetical protein [Treponema sp.]
MMKNKGCMAAMIGVLLVFGLIFVSCGGEEETDTWSQELTIDDLVGTWKGSTTVRIPKQTITEEGMEIEIPATSIGVNMTFVYAQGAQVATIKTDVDIEQPLDTIAAETGMDKDLLWAFIGEGQEKYIITETETVSTNEILAFFQVAGSKIEINQDGTKVKLSQPVDAIMSDDDIPIKFDGDTISITLSKQ